MNCVLSIAIVDVEINIFFLVQIQNSHLIGSSSCNYRQLTVWVHGSIGITLDFFSLQQFMFVIPQQHVVSLFPLPF